MNEGRIVRNLRRTSRREGRKNKNVEEELTGSRDSLLDLSDHHVGLLRGGHGRLSERSPLLVQSRFVLSDDLFSLESELLVPVERSYAAVSRRGAAKSRSVARSGRRVALRFILGPESGQRGGDGLGESRERGDGRGDGVVSRGDDFLFLGARLLSRVLSRPDAGAGRVGGSGRNLGEHDAV